ncbi:MAG: hypothetical protein AAF939_10140 [Planctomycetota bacterium]
MKFKGSKNTIAATVGNFSTTAALAVAIVTLTQFGSAENVGHFSFALAVATPVFLLMQLRLRDVIATDLDLSAWHAYRRLSISSNVCGAVIAGPIAFLAGLSQETIVATILIACWKATVGVSDLVYGWHQRDGRLVDVARLQVGHSIATGLSFFIVFVATRNLAITLSVVFIVNLILLVLVDLKSIDAATGISPSDDRRSLWPLLKRNLPLGLAGAIFSLNMILPRDQLEHSFSMVEVGLFSAIAFLARAGTPMMQAFGQTSTKRLNQCVIESNGRGFIATLMRAVTLPLLAGLGLVVVFWVAGQPLVALLYGPAYARDPVAIVLIMAYACLVYLSTVLTYGIIAAGRFKSQLLILSCSVLITYFVGARLIPNSSVQGACWAVLSGATFRILATAGVVAWSAWSMRLQSKFDFSVPGAT